MNSADTQVNRSKILQLLIVGRVLLTTGVASLSVGAAIGAALWQDIGALPRTILGVAISAVMVIAGELVSQRSKKHDSESWRYKLGEWASTNLMSAGYFLAYFFVYSMYYVPGLHMLETPYLSWLMGPVLAAVATWHGSRNRSMRWVTPVYTLLITGHASYHALTSTAVLTLGGFSVQVAAIGCVLGAIWCATLSRVYERFTARYNWGKTFEESADYLLNRVAHEVYFVFAALNAMALPVVLGNFEQAPLWWSLIAPALLALSWRTGNWYKHSVVALIWVAAAATLLSNSYHNLVALPVLLSVPLSGAAMGLCYRYRQSAMAQMLKLSGYCAYLYAAIVVALLVPFLQFGNVWDTMPFWMIESLVICGMGLALRDRIVHFTGAIVSLGALVIFGMQWHTWTWGLAGPVIACAYSLSVAYGQISKRGGWKSAEFLAPFEFGETVSVEGARKLESLWSWVGVAVLFASSFLLINQTEAVIWWAVEALLLVLLASAASSERYRNQGLLAFGLAAAKLVFWDTCGGQLGLHNADAMFSMYRSLEFSVFGACAVLASALFFREEAKLRAALKAAEAKEQGQEQPTGGEHTEGAQSSN